MPNGGMKPCCWICRWGTLQDIQESSVICEQHHLTIYLPLATFCSELVMQSGGQSHYFAGREFSPEPGSMYEWLEVAYEDSRYPGIPQYFKEPVELAALGEFATWNKYQQIKTSQARYEQKRQGLTKLDS
jgi:hypothetical protein